MVRTGLQLLFVIALSVLVVVYYGLVLPAGLAGVMGVFVACALGVTLLLGKIEVKPILFGSAALAAWPAGVWVAEFLSAPFGGVSPEVARAASVFVAAAAGHFAYAWAEKRDRARDIALSTLSVISVYTLVSSIYSGQRAAVAVACLAVAWVVLLARQQMIVPPEHERALLFAAGIAGATGLVHGMFALLF